MGDISKDKVSVRKMFDEISPTYDLLNHVFTANLDKKWRRKAVLNIARQNNYECILDLASGTGDFAKEFLRLNPKRIYSADLSFDMLRLNKNKINSNNHLALHADAGALPFYDTAFDVVGIAFGVRNFENLDKCLKEIYRVLKKGGRFITIEMFGRDSAANKGLFNYYFKHVLPKIGNLVSKSSYAYNYLFDSVDKFITVEQYSDMLLKNDFKVTSLINNFQKFVYTIIASKT